MKFLGFASKYQQLTRQVSVYEGKSLVPPYGPKPRLVLMHLNGEALRQQSRHIEIDATLTRFVKRIGLPSKGKNISSVRTHVGKLANTEIRLAGQIDHERRAQRNTHIIDGFDLWFTPDENQRVLWPGNVTLSEHYYNSLVNHAVPLSERAIAGLRNNTMALDMYAWLAQRLHRVDRHQGIPWPRLQQQFGQGYSRLRGFREAFTRNLQKVLAVYPQANIKLDHRGAQLYTSPPPISKRMHQVLLPNVKK